MSEIQNIAKLEREITKLRNTPISLFGSLDDKKAAINSVQSQIDEAKRRMSMKTPSISTETMRNLQSVFGEMFKFDSFKSCWISLRKHLSDAFLGFDEELLDLFLNNSDAIKSSEAVSIKKVFEMSDSIECHKTRNLSRLLAMVMTAVKLEKFSTVNYTPKMFEELLNLIIGTILKYRVELATDIVLQSMGIFSKQDVNFCDKLDIDSIRTPDFIQVRDNEFCLLETNFSSRNVKGVYSKGMKLTTSKYYEEMYYINTRLSKEIVYCPLIFYDEMTRESKFNSLKEQFISGNISGISFDVHVENFFKVLLKFSNFMRQRRDEREHLMSVLPLVLRVIDVMNKQIYPQGKVMNRCFSCLNDVKFANEVVDLSFGTKKVVEYNERMLLASLKEVGLTRISEVLHYMYSGERPARDLVKLKKQCIWAKRNQDEILKNDHLIVEPEVTQGLRKMFKLIFETIGVDTIGHNTRRERLILIMDYEDISRSYFSFIDISYDKKYDGVDKIDFDDSFSIPKFKYVKNPELSKIKSVRRIEEKLNIEGDSFDDLRTGFSTEIEAMNILSVSHESKRYHLVLEDSELIDLTKNLRLNPQMVTVHITRSSSWNLSLVILLENFTFSTFDEMRLNDNDVLIKLDSPIIHMEPLSFEDVEMISQIIVDESNLVVYDVNRDVGILKGIDEVKFFSTRYKDVIFRPQMSMLKIVDEITTKVSDLKDNFTKFRFDILTGNYLEEYCPSVSMKDTIDAMTELSLAQEVCTRRNEFVNIEEIMELIPESTLKKPDPSLVPRAILSESSITDEVFESFSLDNQQKLIARMKSMVKDEKGFKRQGFVFHKDHVMFKGLRLSYDSARVKSLLQTSDKLRRDVVFREPYRRMIDHCNRKKELNKNSGWVEKVYKPEMEEIDEFDNILESLCEFPSDTEMPCVIEESLYSMIGQDAVRSVSESYLKLIFGSSYISTYHRISKLYSSICFESAKWRTRKDEVIAFDENLKNVSYYIVDSKKVTNDITKTRYFLAMRSNDSETFNHSYFKNYDEDREIVFTNVHEEDIEILRFRSNLFNNVMMLFFYYYRKSIFSDQEIVTGFIKLYNLLFTLSTSTKNILSVFKYLNVLNFSDYSNPYNLFKKYLAKDKHKRLIHYSYMRKIVNNYNENLRTISGFIDKDDQIQPIRNLYNFSIPLATLWGYVHSIKDMIESNTFYNLVEKKTTQFRHSMKTFIETVVENNDAMSGCDKNGVSITDVTVEMVNRNSKSFYCRESVYYGISLVMSDIFTKLRKSRISDRAVSSQFDRVKSKMKLDSEYFSTVMSDRCYSRFSKNFLSSRKSMAMKKSDKTSGVIKLRMIDTTLELLNLFFKGEDSISPVSLFERVISAVENDEPIAGKTFRYFCNLATITRKEQHESDREIYVLFLITKILTVFVQHVFFSINILVEEEMVVKPQVTKLELIKEITSKIYELPKDFEVVYMNGDMASWSGRDIFDKFMFATDCLHSSGFVSRKVMNMVKFCLKMTSSMRILISPEDVKSEKFDKNSLAWNDHFNAYELTYTHSWPQGVFHNISSFIHACEQRLKHESLDRIGINPRYHKFLDHSDDKNEIVALKLESYENYIKFSNYFPSFFSLKPSLTKDSFSRLVSEMVGLQNVRGRLFDNPVKSIRDISTRVKSPFFIQCYKSSISSISEFYNKSNDLVTTYFMNMVSYTSLSQLFGIDTSKLKFMPVDYGGFFDLPFDCLSLHGMQSDIVHKSRVLSKFHVDIGKLINEHPLTMRFLRDKSMLDMIRRLKSFKEIEKLKFDLDQSPKIVIDNIVRSKINERIEMFRKRDSFTDIMNLKHKSANRIILSTPDSSLILGQDEIASLFDKSIVSYVPKIARDLITSEDVIDTLVMVSRRDIRLHNSYSPSDIREMNDHTLVEVRNSSKFSNIDLEMIEDLFERRFDSVFKSYSNFKRRMQIVEEFSSICNHFCLTDISDFKQQKQKISMVMESDLTKNLIQFKTSSSVIGHVDYYSDLVGIKADEDLDDSFMKLRPRSMIEKSGKNFRDLSKRLKSFLNRHLLNGTDWDVGEVTSLFSQGGVSLSQFLSEEKDEYLKCVIRYSYGRDKNKFGSVSRATSFSWSNYFKKKTLMRFDEMQIEVGIVLSKDSEVTDVFVCDGINHSYYLLNDTINVNEVNRKLFYRCTRNSTKIDFELFSDYDSVKDFLSNQGFTLVKHPKSIILNETTLDKSLIRHGNFFELEQKSSRSIRLVRPKLYTEIPEFKRQIFNVAHISTNLSGGVLNPESQKNDIKIANVSRYVPRLKIGRKVMSEFYRILVDEFRIKSWFCYINIDHNHEGDDNVLCLHTCCFKSNNEELPMMKIEEMAAEFDETSGTKVYPIVTRLVISKTEDFRKKGRVTAGEILIPRETDCRNLFETSYEIPDDTSYLFVFLRVLEQIIMNQLKLESLDIDTTKDNINLYRTLKVIMETDDRMERSLKCIDEAYELIENILKNEVLAFSVTNFKTEFKIRKTKTLNVSLSNLGQVLDRLSKFFSFEKDLDYKSRLISVDDSFKIGSEHDNEMNMVTRINLGKLEQKKLEDARESLLRDKHEYIPRDQFDTMLEAKIKEEKKRLLDENLSEKILLTSKVETLEREVSLMCKEKQDYEARIKGLEEVCGKQYSQIEELRSINNRLTDEIYIAKAEISDWKERVKDTEAELKLSRRAPLYQMTNISGFTYLSDGEESAERKIQRSTKKEIADREYKLNVSRRNRLKREEAERVRLEEERRKAEEEKAIEEAIAKAEEERILLLNDEENARVERILMKFEEVTSPKRYRNYFGPFFDPKYKVRLPIFSFINETFDVDVFSEDQPSPFSLLIKALTMAFSIQYKNMMEDFVNGHDPDFKLKFIRLIQKVNPQDYLKANGEPSEFTSIEETNELTDIFKSIMSALLSFSNSVKKRYNFKIPAAYKLKGLRDSPKDELIRLGGEIVRDLIDPLINHFEMRKVEHEKVFVLVKRTLSLSKRFRVEAYKLLKKKMLENDGNLDESDERFLIDRRFVTDAFRVLQYVEDILNGFIRCLSKLKHSLLNADYD